MERSSAFGMQGLIDSQAWQVIAQELAKLRNGAIDRLISAQCQEAEGHQLRGEIRAYAIALSLPERILETFSAD